MAIKKRTELEVEEQNSYFEPEGPVEFISSGCTILNCVLGGGFPLGRVVNIVGDKSTGKTLLAMEAATNLLIQYPNAQCRYIETEAAFDTEYAKSLGIPIGKNLHVVRNVNTIEELFSDLASTIERAKKEKVPYLYIVDSLDALSYTNELERDITEGSYGAEKAKKLSELFRRHIRSVFEANICLLIISQVRENIGVTFGDKYTRSGGKALEFYSSQILWLAHLGQEKKQKKGIERVIGVNIKANCKKNKIGLPFRNCEFTILFGYGIDDISATKKWLKKVNREDLLREEGKYDSVEVLDLWNSIEKEFLPQEKKY